MDVTQSQSRVARDGVAARGIVRRAACEGSNSAASVANASFVVIQHGRMLQRTTRPTQPAVTDRSVHLAHAKGSRAPADRRVRSLE